ncbi:germ cell-less protein-like 1 isoform X2 [Eurytemora carolleeae]|uniref:germ cell-less protein-like 1 isoform X2 n=1 Tax=Eurytemora carolleeae TaxID=1294199 RepID=UPI000C791353|nr:germ cell-less protein-like 1 isoform X2 [Eurytemora carolleeae]|eukprot:XP_023346472.1 germ cell-less protein-like 1 isoform X2 [Eurytemora affinis]
MGGLTSKPVQPSPGELRGVGESSELEDIQFRVEVRKRKRKRSEDIEKEELDRLLSTPKKKILKTTSQYIFDNLFQDGKDSDVTLTALGTSWKLHKLYLCQSAYFASMFSGRWTDGSKETINIQIDDPNININSLHITLGSFYRDDVTIEPSDVVSVLAAASLFQLDGLISQCIVIMDETINIQTVVQYHDSSVRYGCVELTKSCINWLLANLLSIMPDNPLRLREIPPSLMGQLIGSPHLFVIQTEFSVYVLLRLWVYLKLHPACDTEPRESVNESHKYFRSMATSGKNGRTEYFLDSESAKPYLAVFRNMRIVHMINHHLDLESLVSDRIIPNSWLSSVFYTRWMSLLRIDSGIDKGPSNLSEETFNRECYRCGRILQVDGQHMWRWTGFNSGMDLIITYENYRLTLKRSGLSDHEALLSNHGSRNISYRVTVLSLNDQKQRIYVKFYCTVLYCTVVYCTVLQCHVPYCTVLIYIVE